jgi:hypothetical protein
MSDGLCGCGCGHRTKLAEHTSRTIGHVKGEPMPYLRGHQGRKSPMVWIEDPETGCRIWQRGTNSAGYGRFGVKGKKVLAHRAFYEYVRGRIPEGLEVDHLCGNPLCVRIDHLEAVTHAENTRRGKRAKLDHAKVAAIRVSNEKPSTLAKHYGVTAEAIRRARAGRRWA